MVADSLISRSERAAGSSSAALTSRSSRKSTTRSLTLNLHEALMGSQALQREEVPQCRQT